MDTMLPPPIDYAAIARTCPPDTDWICPAERPTEADCAECWQDWRNKVVCRQMADRDFVRKRRKLEERIRRTLCKPQGKGDPK